MTYSAPNGEKGTQLLKACLFDYFRTDATLLSYLGSGTNGFYDEGEFEAESPTPAVVNVTFGDGEATDHTLLRIVLWVVDRGRGFFEIERIIERIQYLFGATDPAVGQAALNYFTFLPADHKAILSIRTNATTASASFPSWQTEGRAVYFFFHIEGFTTYA